MYHTIPASLLGGNETQIRRFYERFSLQRNLFLSQIQGHLPWPERNRYGSLIVCRIMFLYFLQERGFLDADAQYLSHRLEMVQRLFGPQTFYRQFLLPLFRFAAPTTAIPAKFSLLFGRLPHLGNELFPSHLFEEPDYALHIPDEAFSQLFAFFNHYRWNLSEDDNESPDVLNPTMVGAIAELYVNQQQMGAYYTKIDITSYIVRNTVVPYIFEVIVRVCPHLFTEKYSPWSLLRLYPERYISPVLQYEEYLPDETLREYEERRASYTKAHAYMVTGNIISIDDLITWNLDIQRFLMDTLRLIDTYADMLACYREIRQITILDPTCGSGAFLFAALDILVPCYELCLEQLEALRPSTCNADEFEEVQCVCNRRYFILKSIITTHLFGVDIMEEAIEICRLRLFLKAIAQVECMEDIEPLPLLNTHLQVGNALGESAGLTGRAELSAIKISYSHKTQEKITERGFSWNATFENVMQEGGFAIIIGNPPYVEYNPEKFPYTLYEYKTLPCANLYPCVIERSRQLLAQGGRQGMILPLAAFATRNMVPFLEQFRQWFPGTWVSFFHFRPSMLFTGCKVASIPTAIFLARSEGSEQRFSTSLLKWTQDSRALLFSRLTYCQITIPQDSLNRHYYPKFGSEIENAIMQKILTHSPLRTYLAKNQNTSRMFYRSAGGLYWKVFVNFPWPYPSTSNKHCSFQEKYKHEVFIAVLNSSLFWWYYTTTFDTFNLKDYMLFGFRFTYPEDNMLIDALTRCCERLMNDFRLHAQHLKRGASHSYTIYARKSKPIIDEIDHLLALHYGFSAEERDFILHYDVKYRTGL